MFCSGKVFYDLHAEREKRGLDKKNEVAIVRIEQVRVCVCVCARARTRARAYSHSTPCPSSVSVSNRLRDRGFHLRVCVCVCARVCVCVQLSPFPFDLVLRELKRYPNAEVVWCQEEPQNMGAYFYVQPRIISTLM